MFLFHTKIDAFSTFTINLGPLYVERVFDSLLTRKGIREIAQMTDTERFSHYLDYIKTKSNSNSRNRYAIIQFYKGHFHQQLSMYSTHPEEIQHFQEKALCYYQNYLELSKGPEESRYYAQWQAGVLQDGLHYPWLEVEDSLLWASAIDPLRGEAIKKIIAHYIQLKDWNKAYFYSSRAISQFLHKNPVAKRRWFVDFDAYNEKLIGTHLSIQTKYLTHGTITSKTNAEYSQL